MKFGIWVPLFMLSSIKAVWILSLVLLLAFQVQATSTSSYTRTPAAALLLTKEPTGSLSSTLAFQASSFNTRISDQVLNNRVCKRNCSTVHDMPLSTTSSYPSYQPPRLKMNVSLKSVENPTNFFSSSNKDRTFGLDSRIEDQENSRSSYEQLSGHDLLFQQLIHRFGSKDFLQKNGIQIVHDDDLNDKFDDTALSQTVIVKSLVWTATIIATRCDTAASLTRIDSSSIVQNGVTPSSFNLPQDTTTRKEEEEINNVQNTEFHFVTVLPLNKQVDEERMASIVSNFLNKKNNSQNMEGSSSSTSAFENLTTTISNNDFLSSTASHNLGTASDREQEVTQTSRVVGAIHVSDVRLATVDFAETLTGFQVGTIPPIGHIHPLPIFVDDSLAKTSSTSSTSHHLLNGGSGSFHHSLIISFDNLVNYGNHQSPILTRTTNVEGNETTSAMESHGNECSIQNGMTKNGLLSWNNDNQSKNDVVGTEKDSVASTSMNGIIQQQTSTADPVSQNIDESNVDDGFSNGTGLRDKVDPVSVVVTSFTKAINENKKTGMNEQQVNGSNDNVGQTFGLQDKGRKQKVDRQSKKNSDDTQQVWREDALMLYKQGKISLDKLKKRVNELAMKDDGLQSLQTILEGLSPSIVRQLMEPVSTVLSGKNALHMASWKGPMETIVYLLTVVGPRCGMDDFVNMVSVGMGNYGKSPIFYAITQDRDDVIQYFIQQHEASVLIVNNKGQSVVSLSQTRLSQGTRELLHETEASQILSDKYQWRNFRITHSDKRKYGDLDPRYGIDDHNNCDEIQNEISNYRSIQRVLSSSGRGRRPQQQSDLQRQEEIDQLLPRSVLPTSQEKRQKRWEEQQQQRQPQKQKKVLTTSDVTEIHKNNGINPTQMKETTRRSKMLIGNVFRQERRRRLRDNDTGDKESIGVVRPNAGSVATKEQPIDLQSLPTLTMLKLEEILLKNPKKQNYEDTNSTPNEKEADTGSNDELHQCTLNPSLQPKIVDNSDSLVETKKMIDKFLSMTTTASTTTLSSQVWGLDAEWRPSFYLPSSGQQQTNNDYSSPVALLQLSSPSCGTFLFDLQQLCQQQVDTPSKANTQNEEMLNDILTTIFTSSQTILVGFGIQVDLERLTLSYPHLTCFTFFTNVIDSSQMIPQHIYSKKQLSSLSKTVAILLHHTLSKEQQCSDWSHRPLTNEQIEYAALDAAVLPILLHKALDLIGQCANGMLLDGQNHKKKCSKFQLMQFQTSFRYTFLEVLATESRNAIAHHVVPMGSLKKRTTTQSNMVLAKQSWPSSWKTEKHPSLPYIDISTTKVVTSAVIQGAGDNEIKKSVRVEYQSSVKPSSEISNNSNLQDVIIPLSKVELDPVLLPPPGTYLGLTKDSCVNRIVVGGGNNKRKQSLWKQFLVGEKDGSFLRRESADDNDDENSSSKERQQPSRSVSFKFDRRGGIIKMKNASLFFVTLGGGSSSRRYRNDFLDFEGRTFTFDVSSFSFDFSREHDIVLTFIRNGKKSPFLHCGRCTVSTMSYHPADAVDGSNVSPRSNKGTTTLMVTLDEYNYFPNDTRIKYQESVEKHMRNMESTSDNSSANLDDRMIVTNVSVYNLFAKLDDSSSLPIVGSFIEGGKDDCIRQMLGDTVLPPKSKLQFPRKPRVVELQNCAIIFLICAQSIYDTKHAGLVFHGTNSSDDTTISEFVEETSVATNDMGRYVSTPFPQTTLRKIKKCRTFLFLQGISDTTTTSSATRRQRGFLFCGEVQNVSSSHRHPHESTTSGSKKSNRSTDDNTTVKNTGTLLQQHEEKSSNPEDLAVLKLLDYESLVRRPDGEVLIDDTYNSESKSQYLAIVRQYNQACVNSPGNS